VSTFIPDIGVPHQPAFNLESAEVIVKVESAFINGIEAGVRIGSRRNQDDNPQTKQDYQLFVFAGKKEQQQRGEPGKTEHPGQMKFRTQEDTENPDAT
jgi:hypothetical protein